MHTLTRNLIAASAAALMLVTVPAHAQRGHGGYGGHGGGSWSHGGGRGWGPGLFLGAIGLGIGLSYANYPSYYYPPPWAPGYVVVDPPAVVYAPAPVVVTAPQGVAAPAAAEAEPVMYPRNGQSAALTQADLQACKVWASEQPGARTDASILRRGVWACMDGRGYTLR